MILCVCVSLQADSNGPNFQTVFNNTEQMLKVCGVWISILMIFFCLWLDFLEQRFFSLPRLQVEFSSLDFLLHTKALLSTISFLNSALSPLLHAARDRDTAGKAVQKTRASRAGEL